jgi:hypothetical protein
MASFRTWEEEYQQLSAVNSQNTEDDLKILFRILSIFKKTSYNIPTSLIHLRDQVMYVWSITNTIRIRSETSCWIIRWSCLSSGWSWFNQHLPRRFSCLQTQEYSLPGIEVSEYRRITIHGVGRGLVERRGSLIFLYEGEGLWRRFDSACSCCTVQQVES